MAKSKFFSTSSKVAAALTVGLMGVGAQEALAQGGEEEIVVTGSNIRGTPEDAALPVDVISAQQLAEQGSPTATQLVRTISAAGASFGEAYRFAAAPAGSATVNLRGLGSQRTLVLMNGRRFAPSVGLGSGNAVDLNVLPSSAIGRVEILRDGAAAVYGSDAVGGVVNFITRRDLEGWEVDTEYTAIDGSDGDYRVSGAWGWQNDRGNILISGGYRHRSALATLDRDWAVRPYAGVPSSGGWSAAGNPGSYIVNTGGVGAVTFNPDGSMATGAGTFTGTALVDPGCTRVGGQRLANTATTTCQFQFSRFEDLTNPEDNYHLYAESNFELTDDIEFHSEVAWFRYYSEQRASPMNQTAQFPAPIALSGASAGGGVSPFPATSGEFSRFYIPAANPGLQNMFSTASNCNGLSGAWTQVQCDSALSNGLIAAPSNWRLVGPGGNLLRDSGSDLQSNENQGFRVSAALSGTFPGDIRWNGALSWTDTDRFVRLYDQSINRIQLALRGFGSVPGQDCTAAETSNFTANAGNNGIGCYWANPFSNSLADYAGAVPTPQSANPALANNPGVMQWMTIELTSDTVVQNLTGDFVLDGALPIELGGGPVQWAAGVQFRYDREAYTTNDAYNIGTRGCPDSQPYGDGAPSCDLSGSTIFFVGQSPYDVDRNTFAAFAEVRLPLLDSLEVSAAIRHEQFSGLETTDPRVSVRWQPVDFLALRASAGSTFRAPPQGLLVEQGTRGLTNFTGIGVYRPTDLFGNADLQPESADTLSAGFIVDAGGFNFTADWFNYKFEDEITTESATGLFSAFYSPAGGSINGVLQNAFCETADPTIVELRNRIRFADGCRDGNSLASGPHAAGSASSTNFLGLSRYNWINGGTIETSGVDFSASYDFEDVVGGALTLGVDGTYLMEWSRAALTSPFLPGITIQAPIDRAGLADGLVFFYSYPEWKGSAYLNYNRGPLNVRWTSRYQSGVDDVGAAPLLPTFAVDEFLTHDLVVRVQMDDLPASPVLSFAVLNIADEDPPYMVKSQYNYVPFVSDIVGRQFEIGLRARF